MQIATILVPLLSVAFASAGIVRPTPSTLELVHVIFRHGDRTNDYVTNYPNSPYVNETYYPIGFGELTNDGKRRMHNVGISLRKQYDEHLGELYTPGLIEARSTAYSRAKASLLLVLAGLFPPVGVEVWNNFLSWQPIPINYLDAINDKELSGYMCPTYREMYNAYLNSPEYVEYFSQFQNVSDYLSVNSGWDIKNMENVSYLYFALTCEHEVELELPEWTAAIYPSPLTELAPNAYYDFSATTDFMKYTAGFMLKKILNDSFAKINGEPATDLMKMHLLSGHEVNCAFMLILLDVFKPHIPPYGSHVIFELHNIDGVHGYKIYYEDFSGNGPHLLDLPDCGTFCALDKFVTLYQKYLPDDNAIC